MFRTKIGFNVHLRNAEKDMFNILNEFKKTDLKILMYCFMDLKFAVKLLQFNCYFSASGIITFEIHLNWDTFSYLLMKNLITETDILFWHRYSMRGKKMNLVL